jgi:hypothetical protein
MLVQILLDFILVTVFQREDNEMSKDWKNRDLWKGREEWGKSLKEGSLHARAVT